MAWQGPFTWPPKLEYWDAESPCAVYEATRDSVLVSAEVLRRYYTGDYARRVATRPPWDISSNLPRLYNGTPPLPADQGDDGGESNSTYFGGDPKDDAAAAYYGFFVNEAGPLFVPLLAPCSCPA